MTKAQEAEIRSEIGKLMYEQQLFQVEGNDDAIDRTQIKIYKLRSKLLLEEIKQEVIYDEAID
jgi:hypothetical protein